MGQPRPLLVYLRCLKNLQKTIIGFSRIRTQVDAVEGEHAYHLTTTTTTALTYILKHILIQRYQCHNIIEYFKLIKTLCCSGENLIETNS